MFGVRLWCGRGPKTYLKRKQNTGVGYDLGDVYFSADLPKNKPLKRYTLYMGKIEQNDILKGVFIGDWGHIWDAILWVH